MKTSELAPPKISLTIPLHQVKGIGEVLAKRFAQLHILNLQDVLWHLPMRYEDRTKLLPFNTLKIGQTAFIEGEIVETQTPARGKVKLICYLSDGENQITLRFFHFNIRQIHLFQIGKKIRCYGVVKENFNEIEMLHPEWQLISSYSKNTLDSYLRPIYSSVAGLNQGVWKKVTALALDWMKRDPGFFDGFEQLSEYRLDYTLREALIHIHRPRPDIFYDAEKMKKVKDRIAFDELIAFRLGLLQLKKSIQQVPAVSLPANQQVMTAFQTQLPFELTKAQKNVFQDISRDLTHSVPMLRLLQGDVGSGKTVIAAMAALQAMTHRTQVAFMAPTEILAEQQFQAFKKFFLSFPYRIEFLSGKTKLSQRKKILEDLLEGNIHLLVGTHALFQGDVMFQHLALIIIDEQHRFGVEQRAQLKERGLRNLYLPHQLMMTATPIPRTLGLTLYADLDCSTLNELPKGRVPIQTTVLSTLKRSQVIERVKQACLSGRQAYWVCPLIEDSEHAKSQTIEHCAAEWGAILPKKEVGIIHGRLSSSEKNKVMHAFHAGEIKILIATTVIEVGVNVPNASLMIIENAERMGVAQLHQLRGRVGRGDIASHCILLYQEPLSDIARERLQVLRESHDGFYLAEADLRLRGAGELLGKQQSGHLNFRVVNGMPDQSDLLKIQTVAAQIHAHYDWMIDPWIKRWKREELIEQA